MIRLGLLLLLVFSYSTAAVAQRTEIYAVQIGTYEKFANNSKQLVKNFENVHTFTYQNMSRVTVGEFTSKESAKPLLAKLKKTGFKDAFIRRTGYVDLNKPHSTIEKFNILISELDAKAFYLDGELFIFQGQGYIRIHHQRLDQISSSKQKINLNPNNNFQLLDSY
ncbi:MAG: SPOR domain-containing protein [Gammaproteobacteria bacterium]